jgi:hypothetical protein
MSYVPEKGALHSSWAHGAEHAYLRQDTDVAVCIQDDQQAFDNAQVRSRPPTALDLLFAAGVACLRQPLSLDRS